MQVHHFGAPDGANTNNDHRSPRDIQIRRLRRRHGLTYRQAEILIGLAFGEECA